MSNDPVPLQALSDEDLVQVIREARLCGPPADAEAKFQELVRRFQPIFAKWLRQRFPGLHHADVEDVLSTVWMTLWTRGLARFDPEKGTVRRFLTRIVENQAMDSLRAQRRDSSRLEELRPSASVSDSPFFSGIDFADQLAVLSPSDRELLLSHYVHGHTLRQIADRLGVSITTIHRRLQQLHKKINKT